RHVEHVVAGVLAHQGRVGGERDGLARPDERVGEHRHGRDGDVVALHGVHDHEVVAGDGGRHRAVVGARGNGEAAADGDGAGGDGERLGAAEAQGVVGAVVAVVHGEI